MFRHDLFARQLPAPRPKCGAVRRADEQVGVSELARDPAALHHCRPEVRVPRLALGTTEVEQEPASLTRVGLALTVRPQVVVLLPAILPALDASARPAGAPWKVTVLAVAAWGLVAALVTAVGFAPLVWAGVLGDLLATLSPLDRLRVDGLSG